MSFVSQPALECSSTNTCLSKLEPSFSSSSSSLSLVNDIPPYTPVVTAVLTWGSTDCEAFSTDLSRAYQEVTG